MLRFVVAGLSAIADSTWREVMGSVWASSPSALCCLSQLFTSILFITIPNPPSSAH